MQIQYGKKRRFPEEEWKAKLLAAKTGDKILLKRLSRHESEFVRMAIFLNPNIQKHPEIIKNIAINDKLLVIRDTAIELLKKLKTL